MFDCIICAAGASSRMGALKPLLPFRGSTVVETVAGAARRAGCRVLLVVGHRGAEVARPFALADGIEIVPNERWEIGLLSSIQAGTRRVLGEAFFVIHADMPLVRDSAYLSLARERGRRIDGSLDAPNASSSHGTPNPMNARNAAFAAAHGGRAGHPVLLPSAWIHDIQALPPDGRLRDFLALRPRVLVETGDESVLLDLDTPEEYRRAMLPEEGSSTG